MRFLLIVCLLLWIIPFMGNKLFPSIFSVWYVQWPPFLLLSILVPYGFAKSIQAAMINNIQDKEFGNCLLFLFVFLANNFLMRVGFNMLQSVPKMLIASTPSMPENMSLQAIENNSSENRKFIASVMYIEFGQPIIYKDETNSLVVYVPTAEEKLKYQDKEITASKANNLIDQTRKQTLETMYLYVWSVLSFFVTFAVTFSSGQRKAAKVIASNY